FRTAGKSDQYYHDVSVSGAGHVLDAARRHGADRVVHCSTIGVHGDVLEVPCREDSPVNPGDVYQRTKLEGEKLVQAAIAAGVRAGGLRQARMDGPGDLRTLKLFRAVQRGRFRMSGSGAAPFHAIYIDEVVEAFIFCGRDERAVGRTYIVAGPRYV